MKTSNKAKSSKVEQKRKASYHIDFIYCAAQTMTLPLLHFVPGNSFPSGTYNSMLTGLQDRYAVQALPIHAHNPDFPVADGWQALVDELKQTLCARYTKPVILVGHSMGGLLSLMLARERPDLVRCIVLLDSPVVRGWRALLLQIAKRLRFDLRFSPAHLSQRRRDAWPDAGAAYEHYVSKPLFAIWPEAVLRDYVEHGITPLPDGEGVTLRFSRDIETAVYRTLPHHIGGLVQHPFPVPVGFVGGASSLECRMAGLDGVRRLVGRHFIIIPGGHLFPMETPAAAAEAIHAMIEDLLDADQVAGTG